MLLVDTSGLLAALAPDQREHAACAAVLERARGAKILSPFVLAELDYLVAKYSGVTGELALLDEVARGAYQLAPFDADAVSSAREVVGAHEDLGIGLADASIVVLSARHRCLDVLTLDERHFRALRGHAGRRFRVLPADG